MLMNRLESTTIKPLNSSELRRALCRSLSAVAAAAWLHLDWVREQERPRKSIEMTRCRRRRLEAAGSIFSSTWTA